MDQVLEIFAEFIAITKVRYADRLSEIVTLRWYAGLKANSKRTVYNKHVILFGFLKWLGIETKKLAAKAPSYTKKKVEVYEPEELKIFLAALAEPYYRVVFGTLLKAGLRMQEAMYLQWPDINLTRGTISVKAKDDLGLQIEDAAERLVPIPADLVEQLKAWKRMQVGDLVFGTRNGTANWKWLPLLKRIVREAGLNCGYCKGCKRKTKVRRQSNKALTTYPECERWTLKKFRATYTTYLLRSGLDPRTVMLYTGHEDLATVMLYLSPAEGVDTQAKINSIAWTR